MNAAYFHQHGGLEHVEYGQLPTPRIGANEVLLAVKAAALNHLDLWVLKGWPGLKLTFPHIMGADGAGIIAQVGSNVTGFAVGDPVAVNPTRSCGQCQYCLSGWDNMCRQFALFGEHVDGFLAEYAAVPARNLLRIPEKAAGDTSFAAAAAASLVYVTAWHSLITRGHLQAGESILIVGAGGGVNTAAIQIAKLAGAGPIYVVGSSAEKLERARELGADVTFDRHQQDWGKALYQATDRQGVDMVIDNVGAATFQQSLRSLRKRGRLLTVGNTSGPRLDIDNRLIFGKHLSVIGSTMGTIADYQKVMQLVFDGRLQPIIDSVHPLSQSLAALRKLQAGQVAGKILLLP